MWWNGDVSKIAVSPTAKIYRRRCRQPSPGSILREHPSQRPAVAPTGRRLAMAATKSPTHVRHVLRCLPRVKER